MKYNLAELNVKSCEQGYKGHCGGGAASREHTGKGPWIELDLSAKGCSCLSH